MSISVQLLLAGLFLVVLINFATYEAFRWDKRQAQSRGWRVPENTLLGIALLGGWFGAKLAQHKHRHKTRKMPFRRLLDLIPVLWIVLIVVLMQTPLKDLHPLEYLEKRASQSTSSQFSSPAPHKFFKRVGN